MQGDIGKEGRNHSTLWGSLFGRGEVQPFHHTCLEPPANKLGELGIGVQLVEQYLMVDGIEAAFDIGIEDKLGFEPNAIKDRSDGIMS